MNSKCILGGWAKNAANFQFTPPKVIPTMFG
jgi:hypothetical protein